MPVNTASLDLFVTERVRTMLPRVREFVQSELFPLESAYLHGTFRALEPKLTELRALFIGEVVDDDDDDATDTPAGPEGTT